MSEGEEEQAGHAQRSGPGGYGFNPVPTVAINEDDNTASLSLALEVVGYFELNEGKAREIAKQVGRAASKWRDEASRHGFTKKEIGRMASAFEHEDLKAALARPFLNRSNLA
jgi:serine/threonine-protein kinase HipA